MDDSAAVHRAIDRAGHAPRYVPAGARMASWWLTLEDLHWPDFDREEEIIRRARRFAENGVNVVVIFGFHFRWDFVPYFQRINSLLKRIVQECHKHGIKVVDHYSDVLTHRPRTDEDRWYIRTRLNHHVPLYPDADQDFEYAGTFRNTWRMIDARTNQPVWFPPYRCNLYCPNNPDYQRASVTYACQLFSEVGIDGLMDDDFHFHPGYYVCACLHCKERFTREYGRELPPVADAGFWGNTRNPAFRQWLEMRLNSMGDHFVLMRQAIGVDKLLFSCCSDTASRLCSDLGVAYDQFVRGCNMVCIEMVNTTPLRSWRKLFAAQLPYHAIAKGGAYYRKQAKHLLDVTAADPIVGLGYAESPNQFFVFWALQKTWGVNSWVCKRTAAHTPEEARRIQRYDDQTHLGMTLRWEKAHAHLFAEATPMCDMAVMLSTSTRSFASVEQANVHEKAYFAWIEKLCGEHIQCDSIVQQTLGDPNAGRELSRRYATLVLPAIAAMDDKELDGLADYVSAGGVALIAGEFATLTAQGEERAQGRLEDFQDRVRQGGGKILRTEAAAPGALLPAGLSSSIFKADAVGWHFRLYRAGHELRLHMVNMSGLPLLAEGETEENLTFPIPSSGVIECQIKLPMKLARATLYSPDGAEGDDVEIAVQEQFTILRIPVRRSQRYGVVCLELAKKDQPIRRQPGGATMREA